MAFNTGNPVPSTDARDLSDNAESIDQITNGTSTVTTRTGKVIKSIGPIVDTVDAAATQGLIDIAADVSTVDAAATQAEIDILARLNEVGVLYDSPIRPWSASLLVEDLRAHKYNDEVYIPTASLPFTTGATFDVNNWMLLQGVTNGDIDNDISIVKVHQNVAAFKADTTEYPDGKTIRLNDRDADFTKITGTGTGNDENIIASTEVNQSIELVIDGELRLSSVGAGGGIDNDSGTIQRAIALVKLNGYALGANSDDHFFVGTFADSGDDSRFIIDFDNFTFNSNGCLFTGIASVAPAQAAASNQAIFKHKSGSNVTLGDFRVEADAVDRTSNIGIIAFAVKSEANHQNLNLGNITGSKLSSVFTCSSTDPVNFRLRRVRAKKLFNTSGYYTVNCANNCDDFQAQISNQDSVRSYFVYGVENHRVSVHSTNHNKFTDILIKRYGYDTKNIHVNYMAQNDTSSNASISIEHQNDTQDGLIEDVYITMNVEKSNVANPTLNFAQITDAGALAATTTSRTHNIHVRGTTNSSTPTVFGSALVGGNLSELYLTADLLKRNYDFKHYIIKEGDTATSLAVSDDSGNLNMRFNVTQFAGIPNWGLLTVFGADNAGSSAAEFIAIRVWVQFTVSSLGVVTIGSTQAIDTFTAGALAPTVTYPAGASGSFELGVNVNNYTNAGRKSRAKLEVFGLRF